MTEQKEEDLPTTAYLQEIIDSDSGKPSYRKSSVREPKEFGDWQTEELVRRQDVEQFLKKRINAYTDEDGELREDLTKVEYGRYRELKKQLQEVQNQ